jgi:hypothetical protein
MNSTSSVTVGFIVIGAAITGLCAFAVYRTWRAVGLRPSQRWWRTIGATIFGVDVGLAILTAGVNNTLALIWWWLAAIVTITGGAGMIVLGVVDRRERVAARKEGIGVGNVPEPATSTFLLPFLGLAFVFAMLAVACSLPWTALIVYGEAADAYLHNGHLISNPASDPRMMTTLYWAFGVGAVLAALVAGGRLMRTHRLRREHADLLKGLESRHRQSYGAGYADALAGRSSRYNLDDPDAA